jgi:hypothetical protein
MWEALGEARLPPLVVGSVPPICASTPVRLKRALEKLEAVRIRTRFGQRGGNGNRLRRQNEAGRRSS